MDDEIYEGIPPDNKLNDSGCVEDWGIEDENAPPQPTAFTQMHGSRPLRLQTREYKLRSALQVIRIMLCQKVSPAETHRFLDQFHYMIIGSNLLDRHPVLNRWSAPADIRRHNLLFDMRKPWVHLYTEPVCRVAANGGILALGLALHHKFKASASKLERSVVCAVISMVIVVYMFATSRRRLLRSLREKALAYMEVFIENAKYFDGDCVRAIVEIQDADATASGFGGGARPGSLLGAPSGTCKQLRSVLASSLLLMKESLLDTVKDSIGMCPAANLEQFFEIYEVVADMDELGFEVHADYVGFIDDDDDHHYLVGGNACYVTVKKLKYTLKKTQLLRRVLLCCCLTLQSEGKTEIEELEKWTVVSDHLLNSGKLMHQLSSLITKERFRPSPQEALAQPSPSVKQPTHPFHAQSNALMDINTSAKLLNARLGIIYDSDASNELVHEQAEAIGQELEELSLKWNALVQSIQHTKPAQSVAPSPTLVMTPQCGVEEEYTFNTVPDLVTPTNDESSLCSSTFEGEANADKPRSLLSREDRIKMMKAERSVVRENASNMSRKSSLVNELNNVLRARQPN